MAVRIAPLDDNLDFPEAVQARQMERVAGYVTTEGNPVREAVQATVANGLADAITGKGVGRITASKNAEEPLSDGDLLILLDTPRYFTDFSAQTVGEPPAGWSEPWVDGAYTVAADVGVTGGKVLRITESAQGRRMLAWDATTQASTDADQEIVFKWRGTTSTVSPRAVLRGSGASGQETGYWGGRNQSSARDEIGSYSNGAGGSVEGAEPYTFLPNTWYITRFRVQGNTLSIRTWLASAKEPTSWSRQRTLTNIPGPGKLGILSFGTGTTDFDWVGVSFETGRAPMKAV